MSQFTIAWKGFAILLLASAVTLIFNLWALGVFGWKVAAVSMLSPALSALLIAGALVVFRCERAPMNVVDALLLAAMHTLGTVTVAVMAGEGSPQVALHPQLRFALLWGTKQAIVSMFALEAVFLSLYAWSAARKPAGRLS